MHLTFSQSSCSCYISTLVFVVVKLNVSVLKYIADVLHLFLVYKVSISPEWPDLEVLLLEQAIKCGPTNLLAFFFYRENNLAPAYLRILINLDWQWL